MRHALCLEMSGGSGDGVGEILELPRWFQGHHIERDADAFALRLKQIQRYVVHGGKIRFPVGRGEQSDDVVGSAL